MSDKQKELFAEIRKLIDIFEDEDIDSGLLLKRIKYLILQINIERDRE